MAPVYTIEQKGHEAGLRGWWTVLRNGNPIHHFKLESEAQAWVDSVK